MNNENILSRIHRSGLNSENRYSAAVAISGFQIRGQKTQRPVFGLTGQYSASVEQIHDVGYLHYCRNIWARLPAVNLTLDLIYMADKGHYLLHCIHFLIDNRNTSPNVLLRIHMYNWCITIVGDEGLRSDVLLAVVTYENTREWID